MKDQAEIYKTFKMFFNMIRGDNQLAYYVDLNSASITAATLTNTYISQPKDIPLPVPDQLELDEYNRSI